jgi:hypothetical protein
MLPRLLQKIPFAWILFFISLPTFASNFSREAWVKDFHQLQQMISDTYPNLESVGAAYNLNFYRLGHETELRLQNAQDSDEATEILKEFVSKFRDVHFTLENTAASKGTSKNPISKNLSGDEACFQILAAKKKNLDSLVFMPDSIGFTQVDSSPFPAAILENRGKKIGILRIASFGQGNYLKQCAEEWERFRNSISDKCDEHCQFRFTFEILPNRLLSDLEATVMKLKHRDVTDLVLDLTDNGGGTDWVGAVMRMLTHREILCGQFGFIRHPHWTTKFTQDITELEKKISSAKDDSEKESLNAELQQAQTDLKDSKIHCDRSKIWKAKSSMPACSLVVKHSVPNCNRPEGLRFSEGIYDGRMFVLVNRRTASASEDLVGRYKEGRIATILGEKTAGAGCGFTEGGIDLRLRYSGLIVRIPDCARYSRDGRNEVLGITPDIELPMQEIGTLGLTQKLINAIAP